MKLRVLVYSSSEKSARPLLERILDWNDDLAFPFESTLRANKALFGKNCLTIFELS